MSGASIGFVVPREFCQESMDIKSVFAKIKMNTDIKIVVISEGWEWNSIREGHTKDFREMGLIMSYFLIWMVSTGFPRNYYF